MSHICDLLSVLLDISQCADVHEDMKIPSRVVHFDYPCTRQRS